MSERVRAPRPQGSRWALRFIGAGCALLLAISGLAFGLANAKIPITPAVSDPASAGILDRPEDIDLFHLQPNSSLPVLAIGDSVMLGARPELRLKFQRIRVDAAVGRQVRQAIGRINQYRHLGQLGDTVIIHLGNNGRFSSAQFDEIMRLLADVPTVVFVNVKVPRRWQSSVNDVINAGVRRHPGIVLVNWQHYWRDCRGRVFGADATHLTAVGAHCYAGLLFNAID
jgi:hypothetical protein